jgi:hypothetical protein
LKLGRNLLPGVDGVHRAFIHASHAIDALLRVNDKLTFQFIKARHRAYHYAVGELAPHTFIGNDMRHKSFLFHVHRTYGIKFDERCEVANAFLGKWKSIGLLKLIEQGTDVKATMWLTLQAARST